MKTHHSLPIDLSIYIDNFHLLFDEHHEGVLITNADSTIIYYNKMQAQIDELKPENVLGRTICDVFTIHPDDSPTMKVLRTGIPVSDSVHFYRTHLGKLVNSLCRIYPLIRNGHLLGALSFVQSYAMMTDFRAFGLTEETVTYEGVPKDMSQTGLQKKLYTFADLIGMDAQMADAVSLAKKGAKTNSSILIIGETGVGKEVFAQSIHMLSERRKKSYIAINCAAIPEALLEGILFGTTKGAFTGAVDKAGLFETADKGTLFLDEVDSMPINLQSKLLRVLQEKRVRRIGALEEVPIDVKLLCAVGQNPRISIEQGRLRQDFYYRVAVLKLYIPALRERLEDIPLLVNYFIKKHSAAMRCKEPLITPDVMSALCNHTWPGNVRELEHVIEASIAVLGTEAVVRSKHLELLCSDWFCKKHNTLQISSSQDNTTFTVTGEGAKVNRGKKETACTMDVTLQGSLKETLEAMEYALIKKAVAKTGGHLARAASLLGISGQLLQYKMKKYAIDATSFIPTSL